MATFGERIKELRQQKGLTQRQMADSFGITERNYQRYEATDSPSNDTLLKLADFFEVTTDYLLGRADYKYRNNSEKNTSDEPGVQSILALDNDKLKREFDNSESDGQRLKFLFDEPLQSYAMWLRNTGVSISGGGNSGMVVVEVEDDEFFDISDNLDVILQMSKEHFKILARQLGKSWPKSE
jgi:transcriptional regulator with XRE-family HTH domain